MDISGDGRQKLPLAGWFTHKIDPFTIVSTSKDSLIYYYIS